MQEDSDALAHGMLWALHLLLDPLPGSVFTHNIFFFFDSVERSIWLWQKCISAPQERLESLV